MSNYSYVIVDQDTVCPHVIDTVPCEPINLARVIHRDICGEITNLVSMYTMSHVCFGPSAIEVEDFLENGTKHIADFLDDELVAGTFSFLVNFSDCGDIVEDVEYRYTVQDCPFDLFT